MVQANLLSPDHGRPTFFVSPTGVENFPPLDFGAKTKAAVAAQVARTPLRGRPRGAGPRSVRQTGAALRDLLDATDVGAPAAQSASSRRCAQCRRAPGGAAAGLGGCEGDRQRCGEIRRPAAPPRRGAGPAQYSRGRERKSLTPRVLFTGVRVDRHACRHSRPRARRVIGPATRRTSCVPSRCVGRPFLAAVSVVEHVVTQEWLRKSGELGRGDSEHACVTLRRSARGSTSPAWLRTAPAGSAWRARALRGSRARHGSLRRGITRMPSVRAPRGSTIPLRPATRREARWIDDPLSRDAAALDKLPVTVEPASALDALVGHFVKDRPWTMIPSVLATAAPMPRCPQVSSS